MEDMFAQSQFIHSIDNSHSSYGSSFSQVEDEENIWRLWDANKDTFAPERLLYPVTSNPISVGEQGQLGTAHKISSQIQSDIIEPRKTNHLKRSSATRSPRRITRTWFDPPSPTAKISYSQFHLPSNATAPKPHQESHMKCHSWPAPTEPRVRPQRSLANSTAVPTVPSTRQVSRPSNLSTYTTLDQNYESSPADISMSIAMRSASISPRFPPLPERDLMDMMVEISAFSDDDDDDEDEVPAFVIAMKSVLNLGRGTPEGEGEKLAVDKAKRTAPRRTLRRTLSSLLKIKKGATL